MTSDRDEFGRCVHIRAAMERCEELRVVFDSCGCCGPWIECWQPDCVTTGENGKPIPLKYDGGVYLRDMPPPESA